MSSTGRLMWCAMLIAGLVGAKSPAKSDLQVVMQGCITAIKSEQAGLRESGVALAAKIRYGYQDADLSKLIRELQKVMNRAACPSIRIHAAIIIAYISDPYLFKRIVAPDDDEAYLTFYTTLHNELYTGFYENLERIGHNAMIAML